MDNEVPEVKGLSNRRFDSIIFLLWLAGIPFKMKNMSTLYAVYMIIAITQHLHHIFRDVRRCVRK